MAKSRLQANHMCGRASLAVHVNPRNLSPHVPCVRPGNPGTWVFAPLRLHVRRYGAGGVGSALLHWALSGAPHNYFFYRLINLLHLEQKLVILGL